MTDTQKGGKETVIVYQLDPLQDSRWEHFLLKHPNASVFHSPAWLEALQRTYGYKPLVLTTCAPTLELTNGIVVCRVNSHLTGRRLVSLPFSDHCEPLVVDSGVCERLFSSLADLAKKEHCKYVEIRPENAWAEGQAGFEKFAAFWFHKIDLRPSLDEIFRKFHRDCVQRKVRRAAREALTYEAGTSESLLGKFYRLLVETRQRQGLPPHPFNWFRNLIACLKDGIKIWVASKDGQPVASIVTLRYKDTLVYKYGCSDIDLRRFGGTQLLFWQAIQEAKEEGLRVFDLGRSGLNNLGLVAFKDHWGGSKSMLTYWRCPGPAAEALRPGWMVGAAKHMLRHMPKGFLTEVGDRLYKHFA